MCEYLLSEWSSATSTRVLLFVILIVVVAIVVHDRKERLSERDPTARLIVTSAKLLGVTILALVLALRLVAIAC